MWWVLGWGDYLCSGGCCWLPVLVLFKSVCCSLPASPLRFLLYALLGVVFVLLLLIGWRLLAGAVGSDGVAVSGVPAPDTLRGRRDMGLRYGDVLPGYHLERAVLPEVAVPLGVGLRGALLANDTVIGRPSYVTGVDAHPNGGGLTVDDLRAANDWLLDLLAEMDTLADLGRYFDAYQWYGQDSLGNVHFTGYYTPVLPVAAERDSTFAYPLYRIPYKGRQWPTRREIEEDGVLEGRGLEIAWAADPLAVFIMQIQGSGYVRYADGREVYMAYGGTNGHGYFSVGQYLVERGYLHADSLSLPALKGWLTEHPDSLWDVLWRNPSFTFFTPLNSLPRGAANVLLTPGYSAAVDTDLVPLGSLLLAEVPQTDSAGRFLGHAYRFLVAQDRGGAIQGPGRIDQYTGTGELAAERAGVLNHYGRVWWLLPKQP